jgi:nicotinamide mononucleotide transporter
MSLIEIVAVLFTFVSVYLSTKQNVLAWPVGIIGIIGFFIIFLEQKLYTETIIQIIFFIQSIVGWYNWKTKDELKVNIKPMNLFIQDIIIVLLLAFGLGYFLDHNTDTKQPYLDAITGCISLLTNWYLVKKHLQAWILWVVVDILIVIMLFNQGLLLSSILYVFLLVFSINGFILWKKDLKQV